MYGGTRWFSSTVASYRGLSPRVRGNPGLVRHLLRLQRSIPACTGEPSPFSISLRGMGVYPRVYGGTRWSPNKWEGERGLSPRVRGNLNHLRPVDRPRRSIPACTGEPSLPSARIAARKVYPRVYGGTAFHHSRLGGRRGLSPRVRGNHQHPRSGRDCGGSIPACTGEPLSFRLSLFHIRVYPRVYGGTIFPSCAALSTRGLSPRVRGNRFHCERLQHETGSIPACTGEPELSRATSS